MYKDLDGPDFDFLTSEFISSIPEEELTAADIQGYLIAHSTPEAAVEHVARWIEVELQPKDGFGSLKQLKGVGEEGKEQNRRWW